MKKVKVILSIIVLVLTLVGCGEESSHAHESLGEYFADTKNHWVLCSCGEKINHEEHSLEEEYCGVCEFYISYDEFSEVTYVEKYDENLNLISQDIYDDETKLEENTFEYIIDEGGNILNEKCYNFGEIKYEYEYKYNEEGIYSSIITEYTEDGKTITTYNEEYDKTLEKVYDKDGNLIQDDRYEYICDDEGRTIEEKVYSFDVLVNVTKYTTIEFEDGYETYSSYVAEYYENDGSLETYYNEYGSLVREVRTKEDGSVEYDYIYEYIYNDNGDIVNYKKLSGNEIIEEYIYNIDENGITVSYQIYRLGKLVEEATISVGEDGWPYISEVIEYTEETKKVTTYNESGEIVSEETYDKDGNLIV
ncbi:MAG: hypothetical protein IJX78_00790 [Bacilli bacterium]|nr:hypothetical protein [Bacilli bacterium]